LKDGKLSDLQTELIRFAKKLSDDERVRVFTSLYRHGFQEPDYDVAKLFQAAARACQEYWGNTKRDVDEFYSQKGEVMKTKRDGTELIQVHAVAVTDPATSHVIPVVYALDNRGKLWRKVAGAAWKHISTPEHFEKSEDEIV
jgi:hypothetical protein